MNARVPTSADQLSHMLQKALPGCAKRFSAEQCIVSYFVETSILALCVFFDETDFRHVMTY